MLMQLTLTQLIIWENADRCVTSAMCRCVIMASAALCCDAVWCDMMSSVVLCSATSPFLVAISELLKAYQRWSARYQHVLSINTDNDLLHMPPIHVRESFQASLFDQALTSFYSWYTSVLSLYRKSLMPVIWVAYIAPSNMLRIDHSIFISRLFSHILHNTAFRGVGLMNQIWFFVDNCEILLHPDPSLHCATSWLHLTHEKTPPFCPTLTIHRVLLSVHQIWDVHKNDVETILFIFNRTCLISPHRWDASWHGQPLDSRRTGSHSSIIYLLLSHSLHLSPTVLSLANLLNFREISKFQTTVKFLKWRRPWTVR